MDPQEPAGGTAVDLPALLMSWQRDVVQILGALRERQRAGGPLPTERLAERTSTVVQLRHCLLPRETLKQRFLWPAIRDHVEGGDALVHELTGAKRVFEQTMLKLRWADERSPGIDELLDLLEHQVMAYLQAERRAFPRIEGQIPGGRQARLCDTLREPRRLLPQQPHPDLPATPLAARLLAPLLGILDRVRDRVTTAPG